jgi:hypothetical protein
LNVFPHTHSSSDGNSNLYEDTIQNPVIMLKQNFLELYRKNLIYHKTSNFKFAITTNVTFWTWWFFTKKLTIYLSWQFYRISSHGVLLSSCFAYCYSQCVTEFVRNHFQVGLIETYRRADLNTAFPWGCPWEGKKLEKDWRRKQQEEQNIDIFVGKRGTLENSHWKYCTVTVQMLCFCLLL